jgi:hypothetical protein
VVRPTVMRPKTAKLLEYSRDGPGGRIARLGPGGQRAPGRPHISPTAPKDVYTLYVQKSASISSY